ncbi:MAG: hypothetical protein IH899_07415, partial [Planctomycetes bacterium]|nr:hypothetical protein [Planctomycetota bacterium]
MIDLNRERLTNLEEHDQVFSTVVGSYPTVPKLTPAGEKFFERVKDRLGLCTYFDYLAANAVIDQLFISTEVTLLAYEERVDNKDTVLKTKELGLDVIATGQPSLRHYGNMNAPLYDCIEGIQQSGNETQFELLALSKIKL